MKNILYFIVTLAGIALFGVLGYKTLYGTKVNTEKIPEFSIQQLDNQLFTNKNIPQGKNILFLFFNPDCIHCQREAEEFSKNHQKFQNTQILFISGRNLAEIKAFAEKYDLNGKENISILYDGSRAFFRVFEVKSIPYMILYNTDGQKVRTFKGETKLDKILQAIKN
ncbi:MAG: TlpA family protein disulfide reductase [Flavobacteriaceae bacterium]|jgi:peroxiredoxin|nr:TlpA family protein disulfide reductase [Flavobacteriaceae bacterium]